MHVKIGLNKEAGDAYVGDYDNDMSNGTGLYFFSDLKEVYAGEWF